MKHLNTPWTKDSANSIPFPEYPRPLMVRRQWMNLNGNWQYAITGENQPFPVHYTGIIRVPFSPEAPLSGVNRQLKPEETLWYHRTLSLPDGFFDPEKQRLLLHFGAADQYCCVYVNGRQAGSHSGGFLPFSMDITSAAGSEKSLHITAAVRDVSDTSYHSRGKQKLDRGGMFYTAQSGLWQSVWLEAVPVCHIRHIRFTPDYDNAAIRIRVCTNTPAAPQYTPATSGLHTQKSLNSKPPVTCRIYEPVYLDSEGVSEAHCVRLLTATTLCPGREASVHIPQIFSWTPETPWLYPVELSFGQDCVYSYFAMRKCDVQLDSQGIPRLFLNNRLYFQSGVLDQGYWPDGLYTAPADEALIYDIRTMKDLGFNMLRKHAKIEPQRWYFHCDRMGMLVWQDMVNGGTTYRHWFVTYFATLFHYLHLDVKDRHRTLLSRRSRLGRQEFVNETRETLRALYNHPSIVCWVPFNEGWGQFNSERVTQFLHSLDPSRLVDTASGWFDQRCGDIRSLHYYFFTLRLPSDERVLVLSEFGGYSWRIPGHSACPAVYGYKIFHSRDSLTKGYEALMKDTVLPAVEKGISATIYTQVSDIEEEVNGILTYDRKVMKFHPLVIQKWNGRLKHLPCFSEISGDNKR